MVIFSVRHRVSPLSKAKDIIFTVFLVSAKPHFHKLSRFEIENFTSQRNRESEMVMMFSVYGIFSQ